VVLGRGARVAGPTLARRARGPVTSAMTT
jgi:hypothetical protein